MLKTRSKLLFAPAVGLMTPLGSEADRGALRVQTLTRVCASCIMCANETGTPANASSPLVQGNWNINL